MSHTEIASDGMVAVADRISVKRTLGAAYRILAARAVPFGIIILVLAGVSEGCSYLAVRLSDGRTPELVLTMIMGGGELLALIVTELVSVIVGVVWYRIILLGEPHRAGAYLRFGRRELRYLGIDILFALIVGAPFAIAAGLMASMPYLGENMARLDSYILPLFLGVALWSAACAAWLGLAFPAVATDAAGGSVRLSLRLSRGQRLPLFAAFLVGAYAWSLLPLAAFYIAPEGVAYTPIVAFLATALSLLPRIGFLAVSAVAYGRLQQHSLTSVAAAFD